MIIFWILWLAGLVAELVLWQRLHDARQWRYHDRHDVAYFQKLNKYQGRHRG